MILLSPIQTFWKLQINILFTPVPQTAGKTGVQMIALDDNTISSKQVVCNVVGAGVCLDFCHAHKNVRFNIRLILKYYLKTTVWKMK